MHRNNSGMHGVLAAAIAGSLILASLAACSRPTAEPTQASIAPGPFDTAPPPPQPGDEGYPRYAPTQALPEGYPDPNDENADPLEDPTPTEVVTATVTITP